MTPEEAIHLPLLHARLQHLQTLSTRRIGPAMAFFVPFLQHTPTLQFVRCTICTDPLSAERAATIRQKLLNPGQKACRIKGFVARSSQTAAGGTSSLFNHAHRSHPQLLAALRKLVQGGGIKRIKRDIMVAISVVHMQQGFAVYVNGNEGARMQIGYVNAHNHVIDLRSVIAENGLRGKVFVILKSLGMNVLHEEQCYEGVCIVSCLKEGIRGMIEEGGDVSSILATMEEWPTLAEAIVGVVSIVENVEGERGWERLRDSVWECVRSFVEYWECGAYVVSAVKERFDLMEIDARICRIWGGGSVVHKYEGWGGGWVPHSCVGVDTVWGSEVLGLLGL